METGITELDDALNNKENKLIILVGRPSVETSLVLNIENNIKKQNIPVVSFSFVDIERISNRCKQLKSRSDIKLILIDDLITISSNSFYFMGQGDIKSIIIQQLKELSIELDTPIVATAPTNLDKNQFNESPIKSLDFFCKSEKVKDFVDKIIFLEEEQ